jgi:hypothetical protein
MRETSTSGKILELMLEMLNLLHMHRGNMGDLNYKELSQKITDLYKEVE